MTPLQCRNLQIYLHFREKRITVAGIFWLNRRIYVLMLALFAAAALLSYFAAGILGGAFVGVVFASCLLRDIGHFRKTVALWPVLREVLDWNKIEKLVSFSSSDAAK